MIRLLFILLMLAATLPAGAHSIGRSSSDWQLAEDRTTARWTLSTNELQTLAYAASAGEVVAYGDAVDRLRDRAIGIGDCAFSVTGIEQQSGGVSVLRLVADCAVTAVDFSGLFELAPGHVHLARTVMGGERRETLITSDQALLSLTTDIAPAGGVFLQYLKLGAEHILEGLDHLAFLLALMLGLAGVRALILAVTGFTVGHSLTLILGATGTLLPRASVVEPLIAYTIAFTVVDVAVARSENPRRLIASAGTLVLLLAVADTAIAGVLPPLVWFGALLMSLAIWSRHLVEGASRWAWLPIVTLGFGFIHGFGFVGLLADIGLPAGERLGALFAFNLGVEVGQLIFVGAVLVAVALARSMRPDLQTRAAPVMGMALIALASFWLTERLFLTV